MLGFSCSSVKDYLLKIIKQSCGMAVLSVTWDCFVLLSVLKDPVAASRANLLNLATEAKNKRF